MSRLTEVLRGLRGERGATPAEREAKRRDRALAKARSDAARREHKLKQSGGHGGGGDGGMGGGGGM